MFWNLIKISVQRNILKSDETALNFIQNLKTCLIKTFLLHTAPLKHAANSIQYGFVKIQTRLAFMDKKPGNVKNGIFRKFWPIFGISLVLSLNFIDIFATTDTTTYLKIIPKVRTLAQNSTIF